MTTLSGPMLAPLSGNPPRQLVVLLHGYGSDGSDLIALGTHWQQILPDALFVSPNAPEVSRDNPQGYQWFELDIERAAVRLEGVPLARPIITEFLEALWAQTGLSAKETLLVGFSQGAMMALHVGLSLPVPLMGVIAFSGAFIPPENFAEDRGAKPPVCIVHGDQDQVVPAENSIKAAAEIEAMGVEVSLHISRGVGHGISPDGLGFASAFISGLSAML